MKRVALGIALGAAAGVIGILAYELTDQQVAGWVVTGVLLGAVAQLPLRAKGSWLWWGMLGGGIILATWLVGRVVQYPVLIAWPLLGAVFGCLAPSKGLGRRIGGGAIGLTAGLLGMGVLPLITQALLPMLNLPTTFDYDVDVLGLVVVGGFIGGTTVWLRGDGGKIAKKTKGESPHVGKRDNNELSRRDFIKLAVGGTVALSALGSGCFRGAQAPRSGIPNPFMQGGKPLVVSAQGRDPERMLRAALEALGGLKPLVGKGNKALIKPNFIFRQPYPITTDPETIFLAARLLREAGASGVEVFDAPGTYLVGTDRETFDFNDIVRRGREQGIAVTMGDAGRRREYVKTRKAGWRAYPEIIVHKKIYQASVVVNMPCLKRHHTSFLTCALKNQFGAIYGAQRWDAHIRGEGIQKGMKGADARTKAPFRDETHFMTALAEFADAVRPELSIVDARAILTKGGPTRGKGEIKEGVNRIILSGDMVALDAYCSRLMEQYDDTYTTEMIVPYLRVSERLGLGTMDLKKARVIEIKV